MIEKVSFPKVIDFLEGPGVRNWQFQNSGIKLINIRNLVKGNLVLDNTENYLSVDEVEQKYSHFLLEEGDYVMASSGVTWGKIAEVMKEHLPLCLNTSIIKLKPKNEHITKKYLWYFISSHEFRSQIDRLITGSAQPNFGPSHLMKIKIPLPSTKTQERISTILDAADTLRKKTQQIIDSYDELAQSVFLDMFGDPVKNEKGWKLDSLRNHGLFKNGLNFSMNESGNSVHCLGVGDFKDLSKLTDVGSLSKINLCKIPTKDYFLKNNDLVFVRSNGNKALVGRCLLVEVNNENIVFSGFCIRYRLISDSIKAIFLLKLFKNANFKNAMLQNGRGANIQNINQQLLSDIKIPIPPAKIQSQFAERIQLIDKQKELAQLSLKESDDLFNALLQKAFKRELSN
jgi:type I restriction enzyme, S subunit